MLAVVRQVGPCPEVLLFFDQHEFVAKQWLTLSKTEKKGEEILVRSATPSFRSCWSSGAENMAGVEGLVRLGSLQKQLGLCHMYRYQCERGEGEDVCSVIFQIPGYINQSFQLTSTGAGPSRALILTFNLRKSISLKSSSTSLNAFPSYVVAVGVRARCVGRRSKGVQAIAFNLATVSRYAPRTVLDTLQCRRAPRGQGLI